jgi:hypothetical protein
MTHHGNGHYVCDTCPEDIATDEREFEDRQLALKKAGWRTYKGPDGAWAHSCASCVEDFAKDKRK